MSSKTQAGEDDSSTTVKFNIGGRIYEVSKSLLSGFPDTVLAEKVSSSASSSPIFIDRDPDRFAFCLDYMRDNGTVHLPETVSKAALLEELKFFGFADIVESKIRDEASKKLSMSRYHEITRETKQRIARMEEEIEMEKVALRCLEESFKSSKHNVGVNHKDISTRPNLQQDPYFVECCDKLALRVFPGSSGTYVWLCRQTNSKARK